MAICRDCGCFIDTDADPNSTYFDNAFVCESCREQLTGKETKEHERNLAS